ncbi:hypothetical protein DLE01_19565 [Streptomyces sp. FT05W]|nr:zinc-binding dehydrogenase [Streptomyces sp. FT05W]PWS50218.1 hypothetical protein DLE01_19565 [Streptomyces sp. FT05W]
MQLGADRIIAMARHASRQQLAVEFGATDLVADRSEESVARVKVIAGGIGADRVLACVGTEQSTTQTLNSTRPGVGIGITGVPHGAQIDGSRSRTCPPGTPTMGPASAEGRRMTRSANRQPFGQGQQSVQLRWQLVQGQCHGRRRMAIGGDAVFLQPQTGVSGQFGISTYGQL